MSGYKLAAISISQEEFDRVYNSEHNLRSLPDPSTEALEQITQQSMDMLQANLSEIHFRQDEFASTISQVSDEVCELESITNQAIGDLEIDIARRTQSYIDEAVHDLEAGIKNTQEQLDQAVSNLEADITSKTQDQLGYMWCYFDQMINDHAQQFDEIIKTNHKKLQDDLTTVTRRVRKLAVNEERKRDIAYGWLQAAEQFCEYVKNTYDHQQFAPGRVEWLERQLDLTRENLENGFSEAVVVASQHVYMAFSDLRVELERLQSEWMMLYQTAWDMTSRILAQAEESRMVDAYDLDGNALPLRIDINYWTDRRLDQLIDDIKTAWNNMFDQRDQLSSETLRHWVSGELQDYYQELHAIVLDGRINALNSQLRINIADNVVSALQEQGFTVEVYGYSENDMRQAYEARLKNIDKKSRVVMQVAPAGPELGENELHLESLDSETKTEHELEQRWNELRNSLAKFDIVVGPYERLDIQPSSNTKSGIRSLRPLDRHKGIQKPTKI